MWPSDGLECRQQVDEPGQVGGWYHADMALQSVSDLRLQKAGFFQELPHGDPDGPSLADRVSDRPHPDQKRILRYLRAGNLLIATPGIAHDVLADSETPSEPPHVLTDGAWIWPGDLEYYVRHHNARIEDDFLAHMTAARWHVPRLSKAEILRLDERLMEQEAEP